MAQVGAIAGGAQHKEFWKFVGWVAFFATISLGIGWSAGHGVLHDLLQGQKSNSSDSPSASPDIPEAVSTSPADLDDIEVIDVNNQRQLIPMQTPNGSASGSRSIAPEQTNTIDLSALAPASSTPTRSARAENNAAAPVLNAPAAAAENVLPPATRAKAPAAPAPAAPATSVSEAPLENGLKPGELLRRIDPVYPQEALQQKVEGTVRIFAVIDAQGNVTKAEPLSGPQMLTQSAVDAVLQWHYSPTLLNGQAVETQRQITVDFRLSKSPTP